MGITAVKLQSKNRNILYDGLTTLRTVSRAELEMAGQLNYECNIPDYNDVFARIMP